MAQPHLNFGDIGIMFQRIGRSRCSQAMHTQPLDRDACHSCPLRNNRVQTIRCDTGAGGCATHRAKQRTRRTVSFNILFQVRINALGCHWVEGQKADLAAFAMHPQVFDATTLLQISGLQLRRFLSTQTVVQQYGQDCPVAQTLESFGVRSIEQLLGLVITEGWSFAFIALDARPLDAMHGVAAGDCVVFQEMIEQAGQRR
ncbi:hypothetical protein ALP22_200055 [Pseudomonas coronafaciens pv. porri]|nr:hypothetical protein ALO89_200114 [Pseudomonas coronafaciens pv. porri]RMU82106.1 hypothetical protein ALP22_200055 [Pseudomonas coronafaciens pv. porri]RMW00146.1 hypothetical protein ALP00_200098 [Pseudomonas coronafaciens pv. porri]RMW02478.1 hypothetical protein ALO99_200195 [Pseudomonas coronafaciens pv. porri]